MNVQKHSKKHILLLTAAFPGPSEPSRAVSVANAARLLARHFRVTVLAPRVYQADPVRETLSEYDVVRFPYHTEGKILKYYTHVPVLRLVSYFLSGLTAALRVARRNAGEPVRLIYANWVLPAGLIGMVAAFFLRVPLVVHAHGSEINVYARKNPLFNLLTRLVLKRSSRVLAVGHDLLRTLTTRFHVPAWKTSYSAPIVNTSVFYPGSRKTARRDLGMGQDDVIALFVGDITAAKGADIFFETALQLEEANKNARFVMLGNGPLRQSLAARGVSHPAILLPGQVSNDRVALYMRAADVLVLPSLTEGRPVSVIEAAHTRLPVVASKVGDLPDMIEDGANGYLVEPGNRTHLAARLRHLMDAPGELAGMRKTMQSRFDEVAPLPSLIEQTLTGTGYDRYWQEARAAHFRRRAQERCVAAISILPVREGKLLDAGCGRGEMLSALEKIGLRAEGVDVSSFAVAQARRSGAYARVLDLEKEPVKGTYDAVVCLEVLEHLHRPETALRKLAAAVTWKGYLIVSLPNESNIFHGPKNLFAPNPAHLHRFNHRKALTLFESAGLAVLRRLSLPVLPSLPGLGLIRRILCRLWPGAFAVSNLYLLQSDFTEVDRKAGLD